ncbi:DUF6894 family protein [Methylobacterium longum]|uniref:DUF6894 domain-containing protein n=1 Tax=Methylobacterium longum TaxID=767694 RepID=A0ABT8AUK2_9HYPH|nr:hypothetical protein [Methylobacterium longum]MDN3572968.1 hypothetical protein [Methylobacterium longum]GJE14548.1 hypothetical protein FOHLNKBM_5623 [Methylobacterium longum]
MPRFFIDTDDGNLPVIDEDGVEYRDLASAEDEAMRTLPEMVQSRHPARSWREISATVRDEAGAVRFRASLALTVERTRVDTLRAGQAAA